MEIVEKLRELTASKLNDPAHFVVDVVLSKYKPYKISVIVDGDNGITIDDCSNLSRALSEELDKIDLIQDNYTLEVGTPGLDQPLRMRRQYVKNIGRELRVKKNDKSIIQGRLISVSDNSLAIEVEKKEKGKKKELTSTEVFFSDIDKAIVMVSFK
jgi:ribosome maturation factor RimP